MLVLLKWLWGKVAGLFALVLPMVGAAAGKLRTSAAFWVFHALIVLGIVAGLAWVNYHFDLPRYLKAPTAWLADVWLPLLFVLLYLNLWLAYWLWVLLRRGPGASPFPDIDAAWADVQSSLDRAGLDLGRVPLFLVLGRPQAGAEPLFAASGLPLSGMGAPGAVVRAFAGPSAVFVFAPDCNLAGGLADWAARLPVPAPAVVAARPAGLPSLLAPDDPVTAPADEPVVPPLTKNPAEMDRLTARLSYLCHLLRKSRRPYCPVNGVLALVPEACTRGDSAAGMAALAIGRDLRAVTEDAQVQCPVVGVVCDAERLSGFADVIRLLPPERRGQRFGRRLPYAPRLSPAQRAELVAESVRWVCREMAPRLTYRVMPAGDDSSVENLTRLTAELLRRREVLARLFAGVFGSADAGSVWAGGCYLAGTGRLPDEQGFLADVFGQLVEGQNLVSWTPAGRREDARLRRRTALGYGLLAVAAAGVAGLAVVTFGK